MYISNKNELVSMETGEILPDNLVEILLSLSNKTHIKSGKILIDQNDLTTDVYIIIDGIVKFSRCAENGKISTFRNLGKGFIFGELSAIDGGVRSARVEAVEDCILAKVPGDIFRDFLIETPEACTWMLRQLSLRIRDLSQRNFQLATMTVTSKVMYELLRLCVENGIVDNRSFIKPFPTHETLAERIGTHREAVSKELNLLLKEGVIERIGKTLSKEISVSDVSRLRMTLAKTLQ